MFMKNALEILATIAKNIEHRLKTRLVVEEDCG